MLLLLSKKARHTASEFRVGGRVRVLWCEGESYLGTVKNIDGGSYHIRFDNWHWRWDRIVPKSMLRHL